MAQLYERRDRLSSPLQAQRPRLATKPVRRPAFISKTPPPPTRPGGRKLRGRPDLDRAAPFQQRRAAMQGRILGGKRRAMPSRRAMDMRRRGLRPVDRRQQLMSQRMGNQGNSARRRAFGTTGEAGSLRRRMF